MPYGIGYKKRMKKISYSGTKPIIKGKVGEASKDVDKKLSKALVGAEMKLKKKKGRRF